MVPMYIRTVGNTYFNFIIHTCCKRVTFTVVHTTSKGAGVEGKLECKTGGLIERNTCSVQLVHKIIVYSSIIIKWSRHIIKANPFNVVKSMLQVPLCCRRSDDPNMHIRLGIVMKKVRHVCALWLFTPQLTKTAVMWYQNDDWSLRGGSCDPQDPPVSAPVQANLNMVFVEVEYRKG